MVSVGGCGRPFSLCRAVAVTGWKAFSDFSSLPSASSAAKHRARLGILLGLTPVVQVYQVLCAEVHKEPALFALSLGVYPLFFLSWYLRDSLDSSYPSFLDDAKCSEVILKLHTYICLTFYMLPLLFWGPVEMITECLFYQVSGYFCLWLPMLEVHVLPTRIMLLYMTVAAGLALRASTPVTTAMIEICLSNLAFGVLIRVFVLMMDRVSSGCATPKLKDNLSTDESRRLRPLREHSARSCLQSLVDLVSHREGPQSLANLMKVYRRRETRREELVALLMFTHHCEKVLRLEKDVLRQIFYFLDDSECLRRTADDMEPVPWEEQDSDISSTSSCRGVSSLGGTTCDSAFTSTTLGILRARVVHYLIEY